MTSVNSNQQDCLCDFIIKQQKYIEIINKSIEEEPQNKENIEQLIKINNLENLCFIANIEYQTLEICNMVSSDRIYHNKMKKKISDNIEQYGWMIIFHRTYLLTRYINFTQEWFFIYKNIIELAKKYSSIYFMIQKKNYNINISMTIYYAIITTINDTFIINDQLYAFIRKIVGLNDDYAKKIIVNETKLIIKHLSQL